MSKVTIEDISRRTGLSRGTVSRALNDRPDISQQTKQKVLEACRQLNYIPSHAARTLATGRSFAMAVLIDDLESTFAACFLRGVISRARAARYGVIVTDVGNDPEGAIPHVTMIARERVDGVLIAAPISAAQSQPVTEALEKRPMVLVADIANLRYDAILPDYREAGRMAGRCISSVAPNVAYLHDPTVTGAAERLLGMQETLAESGIDVERATITVDRAAVDTNEALRARLGDLSAVAAASDTLAAQTMAICRRTGRTPGTDIAVVGMGNERIGTALDPALTTIDFGGEEIGRRAMDLALQRVNQERQDSPSTTRVAPRLIERASTASLV